MTESSTGGSEQYRRPPTPDQYKSIHELVTSFPSGGQTLTYEDDSGARHNVFIANYTGAAAEDIPEDNPNAIAFVNDADFSKAAPVLYYFDANPNAANDDDRWRLRLEKFDAPGLVGAAEVTQTELDEVRNSDIAEELGAHAANAAQAQDLINLMTAVKERGAAL